MSNLVDKAIIYATNKHSGQVRKLSLQPYILHPLEVAAIISTLTKDENVICAGILHDVIEDCKTNGEEIRQEFGDRVYELVSAETEDKKEGRSKSDTWLERKQESIVELANTKDVDVKILWLGDKLSNIRSLFYGYVEHGEDIWNMFHQKDKKMHEWYYYSVLENVSELKDTFAYKEYSLILDMLFKGSYMDED